MAQVGIVMGSDSDMPVMAKAADILTQLGISQSYISRLEKKIMHRLRMEMVRYE